MSLHVETSGNGTPLVLLHGWGMHGGVWDDIVPRLAQRYRVHAVDLPGHGHSRREVERGGGGTGDTPVPRPASLFSLDAIVNELSARFDQPLHVCGWSLGGLVALRWAQLVPEQVQKLVLVSSTPCFTGRDDWLFGMEPPVLQQFAAALEQNYAATLNRFMTLQLRGSTNERGLRQVLIGRMFERGEPALEALRAGLEILRDTDLRAGLPGISQPALLVAGERDKLTPPEASFYMAQTMPVARVEEIPGAAHAPFLSHPELFAACLLDFLHG